MLFGLFVLACIALALYCVFDVALSEPSSIRTGSTTSWSMWVLVPVVGALAWFHAGRPPHAGLTPGSVRRAPPPLPSRRAMDRPSARGPDDDPVFIQSLAERLRNRDDT